LGGNKTENPHTTAPTDDEFYLQHFSRPVVKPKMDAIQFLIEQEARM
jgi:hypothetical protein